MLFHHSFTTKHNYTAPPEVVFPALLAQKIAGGNPNAFGTFLSVKRLWGTQGAVGYQQLARIN